MNPIYKELDEVIDDCWRMLFRPTKDKKDPLRYPTVISVSPEGKPQGRTVVLRKVDRKHRLLRLYTDIRAEKVTDLRTQPELLWHFYHPKKQIQIRASGKAIIRHKDALCEEVWKNTPPFARKNYCTSASPATPTDRATNGLPDDWQEKSEAAFENFSIIETTIEAVDFLYLHPEMQHRAKFWFDKKWQGTWVTP